MSAYLPTYMAYNADDQHLCAAISVLLYSSTQVLIISWCVGVTKQDAMWSVCTVCAARQAVTVALLHSETAFPAGQSPASLSWTACELFSGCVRSLHAQCCYCYMVQAFTPGHP
jgi:hypothetical protein